MTTTTTTTKVAATVPVAVSRPAALPGSGALTASAHRIRVVHLRAVQGHAWHAIGELRGYAEAVNTVIVTRDDERPRCAILHVNSSANALVVEKRLRAYGYGTESVNDVTLRFTPNPTPVTAGVIDVAADSPQLCGRSEIKR